MSDLSLKIRYSRKFISWVMGWGKNVKVLEPEELIKEVVKRAREIQKRKKNKSCKLILKEWINDHVNE